MINARTRLNQLSAKPLILALAVILVLGYSALKVKDLAQGPEITLYSPTADRNPDSELVVIQGRAERISQIFINGRKIFTDEAGNFKENYLLANGYNLLEIQALDQFGRQVVKKLQLVFNENSQPLDQFEIN